MRAAVGDLVGLVRRMRAERRVALAVHERPDPDAVGAAAGMLDAFLELGVPAAVHVARDEVLPFGDRFLVGDVVVHDPPDESVPLYALDCSTRERIALAVDGWRGAIVNIDHHHDNTHFGELNLVRPEASSTCEVVCDVARALGQTPSSPAASALYAGLSFDSGHFRHQNTSAHTFVCAAWLVELGADVTGVYELLYEQRSPAAVRLWARAVAAAQSLADGKVMIAVVGRDDYDATGAREDETDGIVETLRAVAGVEVAALVREQTRGARVRVSLRSDALDVSAVAGLRGGGGHRLAAGFSTDDSAEEVTAWLSSELARRLSTASC